jgi:hypothetical protein
MVTMTPAIRPIRFSALKALDPLHKEEQRGENHDRQPDIDEVEHGALLGFPEVTVRPYAGADGLSQASGNGEKSGPNGTHAGRSRFLTEPMQRAGIRVTQLLVTQLAQQPQM